MRRISTATKVVDKFGAGKHGFTNGNAVGGIPATDLEDVFFDHVQEELAAVIEDLGVALDPANRAQLLAALKGRLINVQVFSANGTYTPTQGMKTAIVEVQAGGAGVQGFPANAAGAYSISAGATAGAYAKVRYTAAQIGASQAVTVGGGGAGGTAGGGAGGNGGASSFGPLVSCPGGGASFAVTGQTGTLAVAQTSGESLPPSVSSGTTLVAVNGGRGSIGVGALSGGLGGGTGGPSQIAGGTSIGPGSGGNGKESGLGAAALAGNPGQAGRVIVWEFA